MDIYGGHIVNKNTYKESYNKFGKNEANLPNIL